MVPIIVALGFFLFAAGGGSLPDNSLTKDDLTPLTTDSGQFLTKG